MSRLPPWIRLNLRTDNSFSHVHDQVGGHALHTVCRSAKCPNRHECWNRGTATLMILGDICTRSCRFCAVKSGKPPTLDTDEPRRVADAVKKMNLKHVVLTSVTRDDLPDGGASIFAETIWAVKRALPEAGVEVLTSDFGGSKEALELVLRARPDVFSHNLETVQRFQPIIRRQSAYGRSLGVLRHAAEWQPALVIKSGLMLGFGETDEELEEAFRDLVAAGCRVLTLGQYLQPTKKHAEVVRYVPPEDFDRYAEMARRIGFKAVAAGPMVRSSYRADELLNQVLEG